MTMMKIGVAWILDRKKIDANVRICGTQDPEPGINQPTQHTNTISQPFCGIAIMDSHDDDLENMHDEAMLNNELIWSRISEYEPFQNFVSDLLAMFDTPGRKSRRYYHDDKDGFSPLVFPIKTVVDSHIDSLTYLIQDMTAIWPSDARHMEITSIALVIRAILCPQYIGCFIAGLNPGALYGIRDRLAMMVDVLGEEVVEFITPGARDPITPSHQHGVFTRFVDAIPLWRILQDDENAIIHEWPAPSGFGFVSKSACPQKFGVRAPIRMQHCKNDVHTMVCAQYMVDPFAIVDHHVPDETLAKIMKLLKQDHVRQNISEMIVTDVHICNVLSGMSIDEWCYALRCYMSPHSERTLDYEAFDAPAMKYSADVVFLKAARDSWTVRLMSSLFPGNKFDGDLFVELLTGSDPFMNNTFDTSLYAVTEKSKNPIKRSRKQLMIKTRLVRLEKNDNDEGSLVGFHPTGIDHNVGSWIEPIDFRTCDAVKQKTRILEYLAWIETYRMDHFMIMDQEFQDIRRSRFPSNVIKEVIKILKPIVID